jgi:hypothetical protein
MQNLLSSTLLSKIVKIKINRSIIFPVVLYECETSSLELKEEGRLRIFENRVLRSIFGPKRNKVTEDWKKVHNVEPNGLHSSTNKSSVERLSSGYFPGV